VDWRGVCFRSPVQAEKPSPRQKVLEHLGEIFLADETTCGEKAAGAVWQNFRAAIIRN
jgi:hypothetical protein